jgi:beta-phosphoglucomutase
VYAVIFDVDGVLVDSYDAHFESWSRMAAEVGRELTLPQFATTFGRTSREIIEHHWGQGTLSDAEIRAFDDRKEALYREIVRDAFPAMDGARELIAALHNAGVPVGVGSSGPPENVALAIAQLGVESAISARVTGRDVTRGKPDPQVFLLAAERLGVAPAHCVVIEDAPAGIAAANAARMYSIALLSTGHPPEDAREARHVVRSLRELTPAVIEQLQSRRRS